MNTLFEKVGNNFCVAKVRAGCCQLFTSLFDPQHWIKWWVGGAPFAIREWNISFGTGVGCVNLQMAHSLNRFYDSGDVTTYNAASSGDAWLLIGASAADSVIASSTGLNVAFFPTFSTAEECGDAKTYWIY